jgi:CheY-like chemotaxis protein
LRRKIVEADYPSAGEQEIDSEIDETADPAGRTREHSPSRGQAGRRIEAERARKKAAEVPGGAEESLALTLPSSTESDRDAQMARLLEQETQGDISETMEGRSMESPPLPESEIRRAAEFRQHPENAGRLNAPILWSAGLGYGARVLLIEDDPTIRKLLQMGFRKHNFDCVVAENGRAAQTVLMTHSPDLFVVDLLMPVMDGLAFIKWLRQTARSSAPVMVFTTTDDPKVMGEALRCGADAVARKPMHLRELVEAMNRLISLPRRESKLTST